MNSTDLLLCAKCSVVAEADTCLEGLFASSDAGLLRCSSVLPLARFSTVGAPSTHVASKPVAALPRILVLTRSARQLLTWHVSIVSCASSTPDALGTAEILIKFLKGQGTDSEERTLEAGNGWSG